MNLNNIYLFIYIIFIVFLFLFLLFLFLLYIFPCNNNIFLWEGFNTHSNKTIILLGDSILKNNEYVSDEHSIEQLVLEHHKNTYCLAENHATISDVYSQLDNIPLSLNQRSTVLFLSIGGNNILTHYIDQQNDPSDSTMISSLFDSYKELIQTIQTRLPLATLVLLDIYKPTSMQYKPFYPIIEEWNRRVDQLSSQLPNCHVFKISNYVTQSDDFTFGIEPSINGGKKIAEYIIQF